MVAPTAMNMIEHNCDVIAKKSVSQKGMYFYIMHKILNMKMAIFLKI